VDAAEADVEVSISAVLSVDAAEADEEVPIPAVLGVDAAVADEEVPIPAVPGVDRGHVDDLEHVVDVSTHTQPNGRSERSNWRFRLLNPFACQAPRATLMSWLYMIWTGRAAG